MIEGVTRAKGLTSLAKELGFQDLSTVVHLGTDSNAAKSFVNWRGFGKTRHLEIRTLWLQNEICDGKAKVDKVLGTEDPANLTTKILTAGAIGNRFRGMSIRMELVKRVEQMVRVDNEMWWTE